MTQKVSVTGVCVGGKDFYCISPDDKYPSSAKLPKNPEVPLPMPVSPAFTAK